MELTIRDRVTGRGEGIKKRNVHYYKNVFALTRALERFGTSALKLGTIALTQRIRGQRMIMRGR